VSLCDLPGGNKVGKVKSNASKTVTGVVGAVSFTCAASGISDPPEDGPGLAR